MNTPDGHPMANDTVHSLIQHILQRVAWEKELDVPGYALPAPGEMTTSAQPEGVVKVAPKSPQPPFSKGEAEVPPFKKGDRVISAQSPQPVSSQQQPSTVARQPIEQSKAHALSELKFRLETCTACGLAQNRSRIVFSDGSMTAPIAFVGDGPSREEDLVSLPFVGERGHLLNKIILAIGQRRENSYLCNVVKCAPAPGTGPVRNEIDACAPNLLEQLKHVSPRVIVAMGEVATAVLSGSNVGVAKLRGQFFRWHNIPVMPTWSLDEMLATPALKREVWADMKQVKALLET